MGILLIPIVVPRPGLPNDVSSLLVLLRKTTVCFRHPACTPKQLAKRDVHYEKFFGGYFQKCTVVEVLPNFHLGMHSSVDHLNYGPHHACHCYLFVLSVNRISGDIEKSGTSVGNSYYHTTTASMLLPSCSKNQGHNQTPKDVSCRANIGLPQPSKIENPWEHYGQHDLCGHLCCENNC